MDEQKEKERQKGYTKTEQNNAEQLWNTIHAIMMKDISKLRRNKTKMLTLVHWA